MILKGNFAHIITYMKVPSDLVYICINSVQIMTKKNNLSLLHDFKNKTTVREV